MIDIISGPLGLIHFGAALLSLLFGTLVLALPKGTRMHKLCGSLYVGSMLVLNGTAFGLYNLFGHFGIFHLAAIVSLITIVMGMIPVLRKRPAPMWVVYHFSWMYWSVIGLYAAFASEVLTRVRQSPFLGMVALATAGILLVGGLFFLRHFAKWRRRFARLPTDTHI